MSKTTNKGSASARDEVPEGAFKTKLSATGLVYKHFGRDVLVALHPGLRENAAGLEAVFVKLYEEVVEGIDAIDNGIEVAPPGAALYKEGTGLSTRIHRLNKAWNAPACTPAQEDALFQEASALAGRDFSDAARVLVEAWLPARAAVEASLAQRHMVSASGQILCFESGGMPWRDHLYDLERRHDVDPTIKFVLYADSAAMWRVQAVTVQGTAFTNRVSLPEPWRGLRDADLQAASQVQDACFCHATGFIGGAKTQQGALAMATHAINLFFDQQEK